MDKAYLSAVYSHALELGRQRSGRLQGLEDAVNEIYTQWLTRPVKYPEPEKAAHFIVREALGYLVGARKNARVGRAIGADTMRVEAVETTCAPDFEQVCERTWFEVLRDRRAAGWSARMIGDAVGRKTGIVYLWEQGKSLPPESVQQRLLALAGRPAPRRRIKRNMVKPTADALEFMSLLEALLLHGMTRHRLAKSLGRCGKCLDEWLHGAPARPTTRDTEILRTLLIEMPTSSPMTDAQWLRVQTTCVTNKRERLHRAELDLIRAALASGSWVRPSRVSPSSKVKYYIWRRTGRWAHIMAAVQEPS